LNADTQSVVLLDVEYRCLALECRHCRVRVTEGITTEMVYRCHGDHLGSVSIEIEIIGAGEKWELQPLPPSPAS
jgi:hypothetical protein